MSVRARLLLALAPLGLALVVLGVVSVMTVRALGQSSERILKENYRSALAMQRLLDALDDTDHVAALVTLGEAAPEPTHVEARLQRAEAELRVQEGNVTELGEEDVTARLRAGWEVYRRGLEPLLASSNAGDRRRVYVEVLQPAYRDLKRAANEILALNQDAMVLKSDFAQRSVRRMNTLLVASALGALGLGLVVSLSLVGRVLARLARLTSAVERIGERDFETRVEVSGGDELAQLAAKFNRMASQLEEYRRSSLGELLEAQQAAQAAIDSIPDPVMVFSPEGMLVSSNQRAERLLGTGDLAHASHPLANLDPSVREAIEAARGHVVAGQGAFAPKGLEDALRVHTAEGDAFLLPRATPVYSWEGAVAAVTVILQDVTRLHRFDELKGDLVATAAHELRTPLTSLRMAIHLCLEEAAGALTPKQADLLGAAQEDCERLQDTVDELLDLARLQSGRSELRKAEVDVPALVRSTIEPLRGPAAELEVAISTDLPPLLPPVEADPDRIGVVLTNLVENAIRHSPRGGEVRVSARPIEGLLRFEVRDAGEGVSPEHRAHVFERFYRVPGAPRGGAGLGLSIAREIVLAHGGDIGVESNLIDGKQKGGLFWFTLPALDGAVHASSDRSAVRPGSNG